MRVNKIELPETLTESTALQFVGNIASVCVGKYNQFDADRCENIGRKNLTESCGKPTQAYEMLPLGHLEPKHYNNFRNFLNKDFSFIDCCNFYNEHTGPRGFFIFHLRVPRMVRDHIVRHKTLSPLCESTRLGDPNKEVEYWFPEVEKICKYAQDTYKSVELSNQQEQLRKNNGDFFYMNYTHADFRRIMKSKYKRKEIYARPLSDFVMSDMIISGYRENWEHFCNVRCDKATQKETRWVAEQIRGFINA